MNHRSGANRSVGRLLELLSGRARIWLVLSIALRFVELCAVAGAALTALAAKTWAAAGATVALVVVGLLRRWVGVALARSARAALFQSTTDAVLSTDGLAARPEATESALGLMFTGLHTAEQIMVDHVPAFVADGAATLAVGSWTIHRMSAGWIAWTGAALAVGALASAVLSRATSTAAAAAQRSFDPVVAQVIHAIHAHVEIVANGEDDGFRERMARLLAHWRDVSTRTSTVLAATSRAPIVVAAAVAACGVWAHETRALEWSAIRELAVLSGLAPAILGLARHTFELSRALPRIEPLLTIMTGAPWPTGGRVGLARPDPRATIACDHVRVAYTTVSGPGPDVLVDCSFTWRFGQVLALRGPNGGGKSTMCRVLLGLVKPRSGEVRVGGRSLFDLDLQAWRSSVAYLSQRPYIPGEATVREAVHLLAPSCDDAEILRAIARVDLLEALRRVGSDPLDVISGALSAGQRQRLAVARLLCRQGTIVLLDEPDANLDAAGVTLMASLIRELARDRMVAVAAHSEELLSTGDVVLNLEAPNTDAPAARRSGEACNV